MGLRKTAALALAGAVFAATALSGCGNKIDQDKVVATLDDQEITLGFANFMARYQQAGYDAYYLSWFGTDMWSQDLYGSGSTFQEDVKSDVMDNLEDLYVLANHVDDYGVEVTDDDTAAMEEAADAFLADNSKKAISQVGATKEYIVEMLRLQTIQSRMYDAIIAEADTEVSDEEAAQRTFSYIEVDKPETEEEADTETEGDGSSAETDETAEDDGSSAEADDTADLEAQQLAAEMAAYVTAAKADFDGAADEAGYTVSQESYGSADDTDSSLDTAVLEAADALAEGEVSGLVETDTAYYVLRLDSEFDEEATEEKREEIISERQSEKYTEVLDGYKEDATWEVDEDVWAQVAFDELFTMTEETEEDETGSSDYSE